jgi:hypothetical protein
MISGDDINLLLVNTTYGHRKSFVRMEQKVLGEALRGAEQPFARQSVITQIYLEEYENVRLDTA